jgi:predicted double-glycine peptidase
MNTTETTNATDILDTIKQSYLFFSDPSHGWLKVSRKELEALGLQKQISSYSYIDARREWVYLEEDCDAGLFLATKDKLGQLPRLIESHTDSDSPIRGLARYVA